jgi:hypothetical protein
MFNLKQDDDITKDLIKKNKLIWCRLIFAIYIRLFNGEFKRVSPPTYSGLIEQSMTIQIFFVLTNRKFSFHIIARASQTLRFEKVFPDKFCQRGGQMIFIKLNQLVKKKGIPYN